MKIPINNIEDYKFQRHIGYMYGDDHGIYSFYYEKLWKFTHFFYIKRGESIREEGISKRGESIREGISMHWKGNPFNLKD